MAAVYAGTGGRRPVGRCGSAAANLTVAEITNEVDGSYVEAVSTAAATTGTLFRYDASGQQYIFNLRHQRPQQRHMEPEGVAR
jgi:hypothetical protein